MNALPSKKVLITYEIPVSCSTLVLSNFKNEIFLFIINISMNINSCIVPIFVVDQ